MNNTTDQRRGLIILLIFTFFMVIGFDMIMPLIIGHYVNDIGFTATAVALALAIRQFSQQGLALVGGALADRFQIRTLIGMGVFLRAIGFSALAFANSYGLLLIAMALIGLGGVFFEMPYQAAIAVLTDEKNRSRYYSLNNTITGIAGAIGPLLGVALLRLDFKYVCFGAALCFLMNFGLACLIMPPIVRTEKSFAVIPAIKKISKDRRYLLFVLTMMVFWLAASQIDITYPLRVEEIYGSTDGVGVMYMVYAVVMAVLQYLLVALMSRKFSSRQSVVIGVFIIAAALLLTAFVQNAVIFMIIVALYAVGMVIARPNQQNIAVSMADSRALGMYLGINSVAFAIGKGVGTIIGGASFDWAKESGLSNIPWYLFCGLALISMLGFLFHRKQEN
ncbi:MAG: MFS transporter [Oscillospiraceae bacterium]|jgi:DHA1 family multidrug resistance protein-like MFS transporter|nr:MFS transporter [Oscillospiraceae bacterium]